MAGNSATAGSTTVDGPRAVYYIFRAGRTAPIGPDRPNRQEPP
jgi:hypothetical protein